ncbi:MAG TPA: hypothetical protein VFH54_17615 [Mycobacteriales bacterium]|nr:hypothetical protein [Mycobacteriales bacterium]
MSYRHVDQHPPDRFRQVTDQAGHRLEQVYEVNPDLMRSHVEQQLMPIWDTQRIVEARAEHLKWMHRHWAQVTVSGAELLAELDADTQADTATSHYAAANPQADDSYPSHEELT